MQPLIIPREFLRVRVFSATEVLSPDESGVFQVRSASPNLEDQVNLWLDTEKHQIGFISPPNITVLQLSGSEVCYLSTISVLYIPAGQSRDPRTTPAKEVATKPREETRIPPAGTLRSPGPQLVGRGVAAAAGRSEVPSQSVAALPAINEDFSFGDLRGRQVPGIL